jgi:segregation and condensation protein B
MSVKAKLEAIIYATEEPVTLNELAVLLKDDVLVELSSEDTHSLPAEPSAEEAGGGEGTAVSLESAGEQAEVLEAKREKELAGKEQVKAVKALISGRLDELIAEYASADRGMEIRQVAGGYRMATKPEHHDVIIGFAKSLKPPVRLSLQALETLAVIAYKQPITVPEISEIRGVDAAGVIATLLDRKLVTTAGRKQVIGRPILYKTTKEFLLRFGLKDVSELPSIEEFEKLGDPQSELFAAPGQSSSSSDEEPVTEAVPDAGHHLVGESTIPADGTYATEAEPEGTSERS